MYKTYLEKKVVDFVYPDRPFQDELNRAEFYSTLEDAVNDLVINVRTMKEKGMTISNALTFQHLADEITDLSSVMAMYIEQAEEEEMAKDEKRGGRND